jgi:cephalosporin hydroxylase
MRRYTESARQFARAWVPAKILERYHTAHLVHRARSLASLAAQATTLEARCNAIEQFAEFRSYQKRFELLRFLERVSELQPAAICEIGAATGGTLCAVSHTAIDTATIVSVDYDFTPARMHAVPRLARRGQKVTCIAGDSHTPAVHSRVVSALGSARLDLLFIDGDHSYDGVRSDFEMYRGLVRRGGMIAFHDIVPDFNTRFGTPTAAESGGVPVFWRELTQAYTATEEIIESLEQDGYGIGLITWTG